MIIKIINKCFKKNFNYSNIQYFKVYVHNIYKIARKHITPIILFIKMFIRYLISKYYYKISDIDFVIAAYYDRQVYDFFIKFNKLKLLFIKEKHTKKLWVSMVYYYLIMFASLILYAPITWFLLKVLTDPQNWMIYYLDHINLGLAL